MDWGELQHSETGEGQPSWLAGVRAMSGLGKEIWAGVDPDGYVRGLREGWG